MADISYTELVEDVRRLIHLRLLSDRDYAGFFSLRSTCKELRHEVVKHIPVIPDFNTKFLECIGRNDYVAVFDWKGELNKFLILAMISSGSENLMRRMTTELIDGGMWVGYPSLMCYIAIDSFVYHFSRCCRLSFFEEYLYLVPRDEYRSLFVAMIEENNNLLSELTNRTNPFARCIVEWLDEPINSYYISAHPDFRAIHLSGNVEWQSTVLAHPVARERYKEWLGRVNTHSYTHPRYGELFEAVRSFFSMSQEEHILKSFRAANLIALQYHIKGVPKWNDLISLEVWEGLLLSLRDRMFDGPRDDDAANLMTFLVPFLWHYIGDVVAFVSDYSPWECLCLPVLSYAWSSKKIGEKDLINIKKQLIEKNNIYPLDYLEIWCKEHGLTYSSSTQVVDFD